jgi:hypothetical protein
MTVTGGSNKRILVAALIAVKPGCRPRLIYRVHKNRRRSNGRRKGFTETGRPAPGRRTPAAPRPAGAHLGQPDFARQRGDD